MYMFAFLILKKLILRKVKFMIGVINVFIFCVLVLVQNIRMELH